MDTMVSQGSNFSSGRKLRLIRLCRCADCFESLLYAHANLYLIVNSSSFIVLQYTDKIKYKMLTSVIETNDMFTNLYVVKVLISWPKILLFSLSHTIQAFR